MGLLFIWLINMAQLYMDKSRIIEDLVNQWIKIGERDLLAAKQGMETTQVISDVVCFHCQQAVEKFLKAFLVKNQIEFTKTHNITALINLCSQVDQSFKEKLSDVDFLTDYAVEIRYPDDWYEPTLMEVNQAYEAALKVKDFVLVKLDIRI